MDRVIAQVLADVTRAGVMMTGAILAAEFFHHFLGWGIC